MIPIYLSHVGIPFANNSSFCASDPFRNWLLTLCRWKQSSPGKLFASPLNYVEAKERGRQGLGRLRECWRKYLPKDCFSLSVYRPVQKQDVSFQSLFLTLSCNLWRSLTTLLVVIVKRLWWITLQLGCLSTAQLSWLIHCVWHLPT